MLQMEATAVSAKKVVMWLSLGLEQDPSTLSLCLISISLLHKSTNTPSVFLHMAAWTHSNHFIHTVVFFSNIPPRCSCCCFCACVFRAPTGLRDSKPFGEAFSGHPGRLLRAVKMNVLGFVSDVSTCCWGSSGMKFVLWGRVGWWRIRHRSDPSPKEISGLCEEQQMMLRCSKMTEPSSLLLFDWKDFGGIIFLWYLGVEQTTVDSLFPVCVCLSDIALTGRIYLDSGQAHTQTPTSPCMNSLSQARQGQA